MECPKCKKGEIVENVSVRNGLFKREKVINYFCPLCDFGTEKKFKMTKTDLELEMMIAKKTQRKESKSKQQYQRLSLFY